MLAGLEEDLSRRYKSCTVSIARNVDPHALCVIGGTNAIFLLHIYYFPSGRIDKEAFQGYADKIEALANAVGGTTSVRNSATTIDRSARQTRYGHSLTGKLLVCLTSINQNRCSLVIRGWFRPGWFRTRRSLLMGDKEDRILRRGGRLSPLSLRSITNWYVDGKDLLML